MSAGHVHTKSALMLSGGFLMGYLAWGEAVILPAIGSALGVVLSSDLDVDNGFSGDRHIRNKFGQGAEVIWRVFWYPYRKSMKHGSPLSHFPLVSTLFRLAYLYLFMIVLPLSIMEILAPRTLDFEYELRWWFNWMLDRKPVILGLMGIDLIHWALDVLTVEKKAKPETVKNPIPGLERQFPNQIKG